MKYRHLVALALVLVAGAFANIKGSIQTKGAVYNVPSAQVGFQGTLYPVKSDGSFEIPVNDPTSIKSRSLQTRKNLIGSYDVFGRKLNLNQSQSWSTQMTSIREYEAAPNVAARSQSNFADTLYIVINGDTLREVPVTSWNEILPANYIQQRNVSVTVNQKYPYDIVQAVWWNNDSIAHVLNLAPNSLVSGSYSGYIYTLYNDEEFQANDTIYNLFVRTRSHDSITSYTNILPVYAQVGDLLFPESVFRHNTYHTTLGYSITPNDSSVASFSARNIEMVYYQDTTYEVVEYSNLDLKLANDSLDIYPNGRILFKDPKIGYNNPSPNDSTHVIRTIELSGIISEDVSNLKLFMLDNEIIWKPFDSMSNLKSGDAFSFKFKGDPIISHMLDNSQVSDLKFTVTYKSIIGKWMLP